MKNYARFLVLCIIIFLLFGCDRIATDSKGNSESCSIECKKTKDKNTQQKKSEKQETIVSVQKENIIDNSTPLYEKHVLSLQTYVQENNYFCAPAVLQSIVHFFGIDKSQNEFAKELHTSPKTGSEYEDIARVLNSYIFQNENPTIYEDGYHVQTIAMQEQDPMLKQQFFERMRVNIDNGYPSVIAIDVQTLYPQLPRANHVIICNGYQLNEQNGELQYFYIIDPYYEVQDATYAGLKIYTPDELWNAIIQNEEPAYIY